MSNYVLSPGFKGYEDLKVEVMKTAKTHSILLSPEQIKVAINLLNIQLKKNELDDIVYLRYINQLLLYLDDIGKIQVVDKFLCKNIIQKIIRNIHYKHHDIHSYNGSVSVQNEIVQITVDIIKSGLLAISQNNECETVIKDLFNFLNATYNSISFIKEKLSQIPVLQLKQDINIMFSELLRLEILGNKRKTYIKTIDDKTVFLDIKSATRSVHNSLELNAKSDATHENIIINRLHHNDDNIVKSEDQYYRNTSNFTNKNISTSSRSQNTNNKKMSKLNKQELVDRYYSLRMQIFLQKCSTTVKEVFELKDIKVLHNRHSNANSSQKIKIYPHNNDAIITNNYTNRIYIPYWSQGISELLTKIDTKVSDLINQVCKIDIDYIKTDRYKLVNQ